MNDYDTSVRSCSIPLDDVKDVKKRITRNNEKEKR